MSVSLLVVEDKDKTLQSICTMIEPLGFEVTIARDGLDGLSKAKQQYFAFLVLWQ